MAFMSKTGVEDMVMLQDISNGGINENLKKRYEKDAIYTYIGHVLISVNPFKRIPTLVDENALDRYRGHAAFENPPHVFALADNMYRTMLTEEESQCVIISGESGAGKTEASKLIMQFIAHNCGKTEEVARVRDVILDSNPLLEAFGNAKTIRNNNSSRFGKYMELQFDRGGDPRGGRISNYLLEKSRVVQQNKDERNFHIFYLLLAGADATLKDSLRLVDPSGYCYLNQSGCYKVDGMNDAEEWKDVVKAMDTMGFTADEKLEVYRLLSAILWLGNITFGEENEQAFIQDEDTLALFAYLIQSDIDVVRKSLVSRTMSTGTQGRSARVSTYAVPQNAAGAAYSRDALAKALYSRLFDYVIARVNTSLGWDDSAGYATLGILDIYGFEIFENNGFEQLCINYVNEKLQQIFINLTLKEEQEEYDREKIPWEPIEYFNNKICCDLVESKKNPIGILTLLDDTSNFPQGTDEKFLEKLQQHHSQHAHFAMGQRQNAFIIKHYAGDVEYLTDGMLDKNKDLLYNDLINLGQCTSSQLIPLLFPESATAEDKRRPTTAGFKIKISITALVEALSKCHPHYIRCIKPNDKKSANLFVTDRVLHQVKYLGLLENVKVRRAGYAYRQLYDKFFYRYAICSDETWPPEKYNGRFKEGAMIILQGLGLQKQGNKEPYAAGTSKLFIRAPETVFALEEIRERKTFTYANRIQRFFLKYASDYYIYTLKKGANDALRGKKDRRRLSLERPYNGDYINYKENFQMKGLVGKDVKTHFSDVCNYILKGKKVRRIVVVSVNYVHIIALDKNPDKNTKKQKPFTYQDVVKLDLSKIESITFSTLADNWMVFSVPGLPDEMIENTRKTEMLAVLLKLRPSLKVQFSDLVMLKDKKGKATKYQFVPLPTAPEGGLYKSKKISVPPGAGKDAYPNLVEPPQPTKTVIKESYAPKPTPSGGGGGARPAPGKHMPAPSKVGGQPKLSPRQPDPVDVGDDEPEEYTPPPVQAAPKKMMAPAGGVKKTNPMPPGGGVKKNPISPPANTNVAPGGGLKKAPAKGPPPSNDAEPPVQAAPKKMMAPAGGVKKNPAPGGMQPPANGGGVKKSPMKGPPQPLNRPTPPAM